MIRAVIEDGVIRPLDPLPKEWSEGRRLVIGEDPDAPVDLEELEAVYRELQELGAAQYEPGEWEKVQRAMEEADEEAKAWVSKEMGLS